MSLKPASDQAKQSPSLSRNQEGTTAPAHRHRADNRVSRTYAASPRPPSSPEAAEVSPMDYDGLERWTRWDLSAG